MKKIGLLILLFLSFVVYFTSCIKDEYVQKEGYVIYTDTYDNGGCGFVIQFPEIALQPQNLPSEYEIDSLHITINYERIQNVPYCSHASNIEGVIYIHKIVPIL